MTKSLFHLILFFLFLSCSVKQDKRGLEVVNKLESIDRSFFDSWLYDSHGSTQIDTWYKNTHNVLLYSILFKTVNGNETIDITFPWNFMKEQNIQFETRNDVGWRIYQRKDSIIFTIPIIENGTYNIIYRKIGVLTKDEYNSFHRVQSVFDSLRLMSEKLKNIGVRRASGGDGIYIFQFYTDEVVRFLSDTVSDDFKEKMTINGVMIKPGWYYQKPKKTD